MTTAWIGAACMLVVAALHIMLALGLPLGEFTLGGKHRVLPRRLRVVSGTSAAMLLLAVLLILHLGGIVAASRSWAGYRYVGYIFGGYFAINTVMNFFSPSRKERLLMMPLAAITSACFIYTTMYSPLF